MKSNSPKAYVLAYSNIDVLSDLSDESFGKIVRAAACRLRTDREADLSAFSGEEKVAYKLLVIDGLEAERKYSERCKKNAAAAAKRWGKNDKKESVEIERKYTDEELQSIVYDASLYGD